MENKTKDHETLHKELTNILKEKITDKNTTELVIIAVRFSLMDSELRSKEFYKTNKKDYEAFLGNRSFLHDAIKHNIAVHNT